MKSVKASLVYDAIVIALALTVALVAEGTARACAVVIVFATVVKAPYDVWEARQNMRADAMDRD